MCLLMMYLYFSIGEKSTCFLEEIKAMGTRDLSIIPLLYVDENLKMLIEQKKQKSPFLSMQFGL